LILLLLVFSLSDVVVIIVVFVVKRAGSEPCGVSNLFVFPQKFEVSGERCVSKKQHFRQF